MEPAYQMPEQKRDFTHADFDRYKNSIFPYRRKVIDEGGMLSEAEVAVLKSLKLEIVSTYTPESSSKFRIFGYIASPLELDRVRKRAIEETKLEAEAKGLEQELCSLRATGELTPKKEKESYRRITEIYREICPYH